MKRFLWLSALFSSFVLIVGSAGAQTSASPKNAAPKPAPKKSAAPARVTAKEVQELRDALAAQQKQAEEQRQQLDQVRSQLQQLIDATQQANASAQKVQGSAEQAQATAAQAQQSAAEAQHQADKAYSSSAEAKAALAVVDKQTKDEDKKVSTLQDVLGRFRFNGDIRVRGESFFQDGVADRNRGRVRVRFGVDGKLKRRLRRRLCSGYRFSRRSHDHQRNVHQLLRPQNHRSGQGLHHLQPDCPQMAVPHRRKVRLRLEPYPGDRRP